jgi:hypothetical protein
MSRPPHNQQRADAPHHEGPKPVGPEQSADTGHGAAPGHAPDALVEAVATRVVELLRPVLTDRPSTSLVDAQTLAGVLGVTAEWVYDHAVELGVIRLGDGDRPRLRFEVSTALEALRARSAGSRSQESSPPATTPISAGRRRSSAGTSDDLLPIRGRRAA